MRYPCPILSSLTILLQLLLLVDIFAVVVVLSVLSEDGVTTGTYGADAVGAKCQCQVVPTPRTP